jgi:hypothetical protein
MKQVNCYRVMFRVERSENELSQYIRLIPRLVEIRNCGKTAILAASASGSLHTW